MFYISSDGSAPDLFFRFDGNTLVEEPSYFNVDKSLISVPRIVLKNCLSGLGNDLGPEHLIVSTDEVIGPYFANRLVSGYVEINNRSGKKRKTDYAFSGQIGGSVTFRNLYGKFIGRERYGGVLEGQRIDGNHFGLDMEGGVAVLDSVNGAYPFKNMNGGLVVLGRCKGENPLYGMKSGIAIVDSFESKGKPVFPERDGGTIITTEKSLTGDEDVDKLIFDNAIVFSGKDASRKLKSFAGLILSLTYPWLIEKYNGVVYSSILESFRNSDRSSESYKDLLDECLEWTVPVDIRDGATIFDVEKNRKDIYEKSKLIPVLHNVERLRNVETAPDFYKNNKPEAHKILLNRIYDSARRIKFDKDFIDIFSDKPLYIGKIEVDGMKDWDIAKKVFGIKS
ncbi:hypothetical protein GQ472_06595 [archaeon]|nr:hypothetical protein [archaeon]